MQRKITVIISITFISLILFFLLPKQADADDSIFQQPTVAIPTVTGTPKGVTASVLLDQPDPVNVRSGPGVLFDKVGILLPGQEVNVVGRSKGGDWLYIEYPGSPGNFAWVYTFVMSVSVGELQIIEPPSTPTPEITQTINLTLAAQFITTPNPTRMPTFTPGDRLIVPVYEDTYTSTFLGKIPVGLIIILLGGFGGLLSLFSFIRAR